jgi:MFS family permease
LSDRSETDAASPAHPWRTHNLVVLSWVSLFQDSASEMLYPILPIFLTTTLGAPIAVVAIIEGLADGMSALVKIVSGPLADRRDRKGLVGLGYGLAAAAKALIAVAFAWPVVLVARVTDRVGKGLRGAPRDALIAETVDARYRGRAFGFHRMADTAGAVIGPLVGLLLYEALDHRIRPLLVIAVVPAVLSAFLVVYVHDVRRHAVAHDRALLGPPGALATRYWRVTAVLTAFAVFNFSDALLILRARHIGFGVAGVIGVYCLYNASYAALSYPAGAASDRVSRRVVFALGLLIFAVAYVGLGLTTSSPVVVLLFLVYGGYTALTDGVVKAWVSDLAPDVARGRALGYQQGLAGFGTILAGVWAGLLWRGSGQAPLVVSGVAVGILGIVVLVGGRALDPVT